MFCGLMENLAGGRGGSGSYAGGFAWEVGLKAMSYREINPCQNSTLASA